MTLERIFRVEDCELSEEDLRDVAGWREYFRQSGTSVTLEQVLADCGLTMDQICGSRGVLSASRKNRPGRAENGG